MCGPGCCTPGAITTPECGGHDRCVDIYGHLACLFDVPQGCGEDCYPLVDAIWSYLRALIDQILSNSGSSTGAMGPGPTQVLRAYGRIKEGGYA